MDRLRGETVTTTVDRGRLRSRSTKLPLRSTRAVLSILEPPRTVWRGPHEPTLIGSGAAIRIDGNGSSRLGTLRSRIRTAYDDVDFETVPAVARPRFFGGLSFHSSDRLADPWTSFPSASFVLPEIQVCRTPDAMWVTVSEYGSESAESGIEKRLDSVANDLIELPEPTATPSGPGIVSLDRNPSRPAWHDRVRSVLSQIRDGKLQKVVLAQSLAVDLEKPIDYADVLARLGEEYRDCRRFLWEPNGNGAFFGATPERLVTVEGRTVETEALAGSTGRGETQTEDDWLAAELRRSEKDRHEHELVCEAIIEQLDTVSTAIHTHERTVRQLATVQHLQTPITATLTSDRHVLDLVDVLHPTPAVGGVPPAAAMETIANTEPFDRGWYAGPIGWIDPDGNGSFAVGIRSAVANGTRATLFAGAGIVADSEPDREWDEVQLKYRPILDALA